MARWKTLGSLALAGGVALSWYGCSRFRKSEGAVLAKVGREAVTSMDLKTLIEMNFKDAAMVQKFLTGEENKARRSQAVESMALNRAMLQFGKLQGLEKDPQHRLMLEQAQAQVVYQTLVEKRSAKLEPSEADLKALYDEVAAERKAAGQEKGFPSFEEAKAQLPMVWKQRQTKKISEEILKEVKAVVPITYSEGYKPADPAALQVAPAPSAPPAPAPAEKK